MEKINMNIVQLLKKWFKIEYPVIADTDFGFYDYI